MEVSLLPKLKPGSSKEEFNEWLAEFSAFTDLVLKEEEKDAIYISCAYFQTPRKSVSVGLFNAFIWVLNYFMQHLQEKGKIIKSVILITDFFF